VRVAVVATLLELSLVIALLQSLLYARYCSWQVKVHSAASATQLLCVCSCLQGTGVTWQHVFEMQKAVGSELKPASVSTPLSCYYTAIRRLPIGFKSELLAIVRCDTVQQLL
jgi:hypothetical protein